ncbi:MAG: endolytic transglycosylase MltG [Anaerolineae bacterium]|nr:endolytic transglycosylase MltG [Anaerolineae bacterium]
MKKTTLVIALMLFLISSALACSLESLYLSAYIDGKTTELETPASNDPTPMDFVVSPGMSVETIGNQLVHQGLITDATLFRRYVQYQGLDASIQAGTYTLNAAMTIPQIARALQQAGNPDQQVTIPEGKRLEEVATLVASQTTIMPDAYLQLAQTGWVQSDLPEKYPFLTQIPVTATLEGFLFPDTYRIPKEAGAYDLVDRMLANFQRQVTPEIEAGFAARGLTLFEGLTLASIVEREAVQPDERPVIAGVYHNRLRDGWPMAACPTVQYALGYQPEEGDWWKSLLYFEDLEVASPYNTYRHLGLPPAPIASPGLAAIEAAAFPAETEYYFFMVDCTAGDGSHVFARTETEHLENFNACGGVYGTNP